jgi:dipeptide/tripeptide permease
MLDFTHLGFQLLLQVVFCISKISVITILDNVATSVSEKRNLLSQFGLNSVFWLCKCKNSSSITIWSKKINRSSKWVCKQLQSRFLDAANSEMGFVAARKWRGSGNIISLVPTNLPHVASMPRRWSFERTIYQ